MTSGMSEVEHQLEAARAELDLVIASVQQELNQFQRDNEPTHEELQALQDAALRGQLGDDMQELARRVYSRQDTWEAIFSGDSPHSWLLHGHLDRMAVENREAIGIAIEADATFDPFPPDHAP